MPIPPDPEERNDQRAEYAEIAIAAFNEVNGDDEPSSNLSDLLCNLRHWCDRNDVDFEQAALSAEINYNAETEA